MVKIFIDPGTVRHGNKTVEWMALPISPFLFFCMPFSPQLRHITHFWWLSTSLIIPPPNMRIFFHALRVLHEQQVWSLLRNPLLLFCIHSCEQWTVWTESASAQKWSQEKFLGSVLKPKNIELLSTAVDINTVCLEETVSSSYTGSPTQNKDLCASVSVDTAFGCNCAWNIANPVVCATTHYSTYRDR